jgi:hypothetical protein
MNLNYKYFSEVYNDFGVIFSDDQEEMLVYKNLKKFYNDLGFSLEDIKKLIDIILNILDLTDNIGKIGEICNIIDVILYSSDFIVMIKKIDDLDNLRRTVNGEKDLYIDNDFKVILNRQKIINVESIKYFLRDGRFSGSDVNDIRYILRRSNYNMDIVVSILGKLYFKGPIF